MIIDCHGHYTTEPPELGHYRDKQKADVETNPLHQASKGVLNITDDQLRESVEGAQLKLQKERLASTTIPLLEDQDTFFARVSAEPVNVHR